MNPREVEETGNHEVKTYFQLERSVLGGIITKTSLKESSAVPQD